MARAALCAVLAAGATVAVHGESQPEAAHVVPDLTDVPASERAGAVAEALAAAGPGGLAAGVELLEAPSPRVRAGAAAYLGRQRSRRAVPHLVRRLRDEDPAVRQAAAQALGAIGDPRALPFLERAVGTEGLEVAEAALLAARRIRARLPESDG